MIKLLKNLALFRGIKEEEIDVLLKCINATIQDFDKNQAIIRSAEKISKLGIVLAGQAHIVQIDFWGNQSILTNLKEGDTFGETYACVSQNEIGVSVIAIEKTRILFLDVNKILKVCSKVCIFHHILLQNLLEEIAKKNIILNQKISLLSKKTIRDRILAYLSIEAIKQGTKIIEISFNRQQLADYLGADRSALSAELSRMQKDGLISYYKNTFKLLKN